MQISRKVKSTPFVARLFAVVVLLLFVHSLHRIMSVQVELHRHLEGSCRLSTMVEEYQRQNLSNNGFVGDR